MEQSRADAFVDAAKKWIETKGNTQKIKYVEKNESKRRLIFKFSKEGLKFEIVFPEPGDDVWQVKSNDLSEEFEGFVNGSRVEDALKFATSQYAAMSDEDFSEGGDGGSDDGDGDGGLSDDDDGMWAPIDRDKPKEKPEPIIDTSQFKIPVGYEPSAVMAIVKQLQSIMAEDDKDFKAGPINDDISQWEVQLYGIPTDDPLWKDMQQLGYDHITMHVTFPPDFPFSAPFIRVIRPRFAFRTGHVTMGGAICVYLLTNEGWKPLYRLEQVLVDIRAMFTAGNGRLDMGTRSDYTESEAMDAFRRLLVTHGWTHWKK